MTTTLVDRLFDPIAPRTVLDQYWRKRALHIRGARDKFEFLGFDAAAFFAASAKLPQAMMVFRKGTIAQIPGDLARTMFDAGATICIKDIGTVVPRLAELQTRVKGAFGETGEIDVRAYLSPDGEGFPAHYDARIAMTLQLEGKKRWRFTDTAAVPFPTMNSEQQIGRPAWETPPPRDEASFTEVVLEPGDLLCLPAGAWHAAEAIGHSLAVNVATENNWSYLDLIFDALRDELMADPYWRCPPPALLVADRRSADLPAVIADQVSERIARLRERLASMPASDPRINAAWRRRMTAVDPSPGSDGTTGSLSRDDVLGIAEPGPFEFGWGLDDAGARALCVYHGSAAVELALPPETLPVIERIAAAGAFRAGDAVDWSGAGDPWSGDEVKPLLEVLLDQAVLVRAPTTEVR